MEQILNNKYTFFFKSVSNFLINTGLARKDDLIGVQLLRLLEYEQKLGYTIPKIFKNYFLTLGQMKSQSALIDNPFESLLNAQNKVSEIVEDEIKNYLSNGNYFFWEYDSVSRALLFSDYNTPNPSVNMILELDELDKDIFYTFTSFIRHRLFFSITSKFGQNTTKNLNNTGYGLKAFEDKINRINVSNLSWSAYYDDFYQKYNDATRILLNFREGFYKLIAEEEAQGDFLYSIDEFEMKFVEYLKLKIEW